MENGLENRNKGKTVLAQLAALQRMNREGLTEQWRALMGTEPPDCRPYVLQRRLAHRVQELTWGTTQEEAKRHIAERREQLGLNEAALMRNRSGKRKNAPVVGTRLAREWNGQRHEVTVTADGFEYKGRCYRSLSAIAKSITGTHWNGRAFFGLSRQKTK